MTQNFNKNLQGDEMYIAAPFAEYTFDDKKVCMLVSGFDGNGMQLYDIAFLKNESGLLDLFSPILVVDNNHAMFPQLSGMDEDEIIMNLNFISDLIIKWYIGNDILGKEFHEALMNLRILSHFLKATKFTPLTRMNA